MSISQSNSATELGVVYHVSLPKYLHEWCECNAIEGADYADVVDRAKRVCRSHGETLHVIRQEGAKRSRVAAIHYDGSVESLGITDSTKEAGSP